MNPCNNIMITPELIAQHGLKEDEYQRILTLIGREPTFTELGIFSAMWNEHCSYKSSKKWLKTLPTEGKCVIQGPGENAGVVDIGEGKCVVFKMESHNHPSYIEPYQGAATGVGGILRDVFTMGARPVAAMNALRFGAPDHPRTRHLVSGVVSGIGGYSNSFGVPTVGGEVNFDERYNGNILVNAFVAGIAKTDALFYSKAQGVGLPVVYLGAKTGRDGVGGATMASAEFDDSISEKRPTVQVGDPFTEKCLLEACLELMELGAVVAIQDMGAAGLTSSAVEMGAKGNLGIQLNLDKVPVREENMTAYEMMLSESQERMLMVLKPELEKQAAAIFHKWGLHFSIIGKTTDDLRFRVFHQGEEVVNLPIKELGDEAPVYDRPWSEPAKKTPLKAEDVKKVENLGDVLLTLLNSANQSSRRWVYEQYDTLIQGNSLICPGSDAGVIRVSNKSKRALAFSSDVTPRYCEADPYEGGKQAVAECWRNISTTGATPLAATDNLNFGNPEKSEIMGQLVFAIKGIGEACRILDFPIVSGNVSLYNETNGEAILPTPTIAGVGLLSDWSKMVTISGMQNGDSIILVGDCGSHLGQSIYARDILNIDAGAPPPVDLQLEKKHGQFVRDVIHNGFVHAAHDISDGGLAIALAEMVIKAGKGIKVKLSNKSPHHAELFGEDQGRYLLAVKPDALNSLKEHAQNHAVSLIELGHVEGDSLNIDEIFTLSVENLTQAYENWFPQFMGEA
ncbi:phosphoribosylformylglycinamidine synthase subunit PurL [Bartonella krasnovii]|uniref:Phosphoribosylformylglycinamidine synthase subunit PurL n=1 Tax=Bartonella krasnovii TaxID=2267275 RepID=A0A5B9D0V6_9HYPH|nr:phosphoribosylformylglycinamidine synthase subunit PurL [Bartonella krasnovii]QEE12068.1 phosphoribosylformylglycinamidine synthase subunit PurL [Bartonella krasnovii]UNF29915.1 phosphoribosylformylglycinamidine synthase subunit PurL [Bartonella krasnovii]UNF36276.1 phosphoribosylformylglycinamidine synthase subunit PurL [Bartonella krasnovii]UNF37980.1 phosphoribosylformylglycinamidine synthase subunit PurL [Bartonella krasnovii]UNF39697.1 phosphoribosylformylglycinamidine synthase subunit